MRVVESNALLDWTRERPVKIECANERVYCCKQILFVDRDLALPYNNDRFSILVCH